MCAWVGALIRPGRVRARETVETATPASRATSCRVAARRAPGVGRLTPSVVAQTDRAGKRLPYLVSSVVEERNPVSTAAARAQPETSQAETYWPETSRPETSRPGTSLPGPTRPVRMSWVVWGVGVLAYVLTV